jgi:hypothetical protein
MRGEDLRRFRQIVAAKFAIFASNAIHCMATASSLRVANGSA